MELRCAYLTILLAQKHDPVVTSGNILLSRYQRQLEGEALIFGITKNMNYVNGRERPRKKLIFDILIAGLASNSARSVLVHMREFWISKSLMYTWEKCLNSTSPIVVVSSMKEVGLSYERREQN